MGRFSEHTLGFIIIELHSLPPCYYCRITLRQFTPQSQVSVQRQLWDRTWDSHHGCCVMMSSCQHGALRNVSSTSTSVPNKVAVSVYRYSSGGQKWKHKPWMTEGVAGGALWLHHWCGRVTPVDKRWSLRFTASAFRLQERKEAGVSVNASSVICTDTAAPHRYTEYNQCSGRPIRILKCTLGFSVINHWQGHRTRP